MSSPEETSTGPVIRDLRRIDPATGQVRDHGQKGTGAPASGAQGSGPGKPKPGRHSVSQPGATAGSGEPGNGSPRSPDSQGTGAAAGSEPAPAPGPASEGGPEPSGPGGAEQMLTDQLAERTADLQRVTAEYANYRKRVERDRIAVREQALANVLQSVLPVLDDIGRAREHGELVGGFKSVADSLESAMTKLGLTSFGEEGEPFDPNVHEALMHSYSPDVSETACIRILQPGYRVGERILRPARVAVAEPGEPAGEPAGGQEPAAGAETPTGEAPGEPVPDAAAASGAAAAPGAGESAAAESTPGDGVPTEGAADSGTAGTREEESGPDAADAPGASG